MTGDERARFCARCQLHVVDLAALPPAEAEPLLRQRQPGDRLCVRVHHDADGNVATRAAMESRLVSALQAIASWRAGGSTP
jgi:hypothetical protein